MPLRRIAHAVARNQFARSVGVLASGAAAGQLLIVAASPLLTRLYTPGEFGAFTVFSILLFTLLQIASLRYEMAILLPESEERAANLLALSLAAATATSAVAGLAVHLFGDALVAWTETPGLRPWLWLLPVSLWAAGLYEGLSQWSIRRRAFSHLARTNVSQNLARVLTQIGLGWSGAGTMGLVVGDVVGRVWGTATLAFLTRREPPAAGAVEGGRLLEEAKRYRRFPLVASGSGLLNQAGVQMPALLLAGLYGPQVAGWYGLGQRVINLPMVMVGHSIAHVYTERAAGLARAGSSRELVRLLSKTALMLAGVGIVPFGLLAAFGPWLFARIFGEAWSETGRYAQVLALMSLSEFVAIPISRTLAVLERQGLQFGWDAARVLLMVATFVLAARGGLRPYLAVALFGAVMTAAYAVLLLLALGAARRARRDGNEEAGLVQGGGEAWESR
jgi:O-antigen/teichoic acid export membrane protein